jgi:hypothetical protein
MDKLKMFGQTERRASSRQPVAERWTKLKQKSVLDKIGVPRTVRPDASRRRGVPFFLQARVSNFAAIFDFGEFLRRLKLRNRLNFRVLIYRIL